MAIKQPRAPLSPKERAVKDRVERARKSYPRFDRHGGYMEACAALAEETGGDATSIYDEWHTVAETRLLTGTLEVEDAEIEALVEVRERYRNAS